MTATLAIVGAGPKAVAVAAKAAVLRDMGVDAPDVVAIERTAVAANWTPAGGWTDGEHRLGTGPEKDVGFPYRSALVPRRNAELDERMTRHSWQSYLIATGQFAQWIDRGRPAPAHRRWAQYLRWVADAAGMTVLRGDVERISVQGSSGAAKWALHTREHTQETTVHRRRGDDHRSRAGRALAVAGQSTGALDRPVLASRGLA